MRPSLETTIFSLGLAVIVFVAGVAFDRYNWFPVPYLNAAVDAARDWRSNWRHYLGFESKWIQPNRRQGGGVLRHEPALASPGYTFITGYRDGRFGAWLVDMDGREVHRWRIDTTALWQAAGYEAAPVPDADVSIHGAALLAGGDVVLNLAGGAVARYDRCSKLLWAQGFHAHHDIAVLPDGSIVVPGRHKRFAPFALRPTIRPGPTGFWYEDTIVYLSADGQWLDERSQFEAFVRHGADYLWSSGPGFDLTPDQEDILHTNNAEPLDPTLAEAFPQFEPGDLLLSLRNINTLVVVDGDDFSLKWSMTGPFLHQHDPDFLPNGHIAVFDNRLTGATPKLGWSRILEIDPRDGNRIVWSYEGTDEDPFYLDVGGKIAWLPNGNLLVTEPQAGRIFEVTREAQPRIVWEYVNELAPGRVGTVFDGLRIAYEDGDFVGRPCEG